MSLRRLLCALAAVLAVAVYLAAPAAGAPSPGQAAGLAACSTGCALCDEPADACLTCEAGYFLLAGACVDECPAGTFTDMGACAPCSDDCQACVAADDCRLCQPGTYLLAGACVADCPAGMHPAADTCEACAAGCAACSSAADCQACQPGMDLHNGTCVADCPAGTFSAAGACAPCPGGCASCASAAECLACQDGHLMHAGACVTDCPAGMHAGPGACEPCPADCAACTSAADCQACQPGRLLLAGATCVAECPAGMFPEAGACEACPAGCAACASATACQACHEGGLLLAGACCHACKGSSFLLAGACVAECPAGMLAAAGACVPCSPDCARCAERADFCLACAAAGQALLPATGQCVSECPAGEAPAGLPMACQPCDPSCAACTAPGNAAACSACPAGSLLHGAACVAACPAGTFAQAPDRCAPCAEGCHTCSGPGADACQETWCQVDGTCPEKPSTSARTLALGLGIGAAVLLLLIILLILCVIRRRRRAKEEDDSELALTGASHMPDFLVPDFLLLDFNKDLHVDEAQSPVSIVGKGTRLTVQPVVPLKASLIQQAAGRALVLKTVERQESSSMTDDHREAMFRNEMSILWAMRDSPNVVEMLGYTEVPSAIVLEGHPTDLATLLKGGDILHVEDAMTVISGLLLGLEYLHMNDIAHRDIRSSNVLIRQYGDTGRMRAVLSDFSLACAAGRSPPLLDAILLMSCSVPFAAPEILNLTSRSDLRAVDFQAADMYAAGSVIWHVLSHERPWSDVSFPEIIALVASGQNPGSRGPRSVYSRDVSAGVAPLLEALPELWSPEPHRRMTARRLLAILRRV
ncbi:CAMK protein kinase [Fonticula alba]|uniref:CAMK protein kinase n=1 Tax=Fonticula alba TaxID=691883 RepID=A0A058Z684_FONAL|nr:CAMK protein kinase [Fonticula alba]KCV69804.1 CAMK protein kinase [Fonticula alba]|eukprot:XP_009495410.1 CAMK protein kinase [Fonticula alba]